MNHDNGHRFSVIIFDEASHITDDEFEEMKNKVSE